jgi:hypothetical protein
MACGGVFRCSVRPAGLAVLVAVLVGSLPPHGRADCRGVYSLMCTDGSSRRSTQEIVEQSPLPGYNARLSSILSTLNQYSDAARQYAGMADPASEYELSQRLNSIYENAFADYARMYEETERARLQIPYLERSIAEIKNRIPVLEWRLPDMREQNSRMAQRLQDIEATTRAIWGRQVELWDLSALLVDTTYYHRNVAVAYLRMFVPGTTAEMSSESDRAAKGARRDKPFDGLQNMPPEPPGPMASAAAEAGSIPWEDFERASHLPLPDNIPGKLQAVENLGNNFYEIYSERNRHLPYAEDLRARAAPLQARYIALESEEAQLQYEATALAGRLAHAQAVNDISVGNEKKEIRQFIDYVVRDYALDLAKSHVKQSIERLAHVSGFDDIPVSQEDVIHSLAYQGRSFLIPHDRFRREWEAVVKAQQQTLNLIESTKDHMLRAALVAAEGSPDEMAQYAEAVFGHMKLETAEYVQIVASSQYPDEEAVVEPFTTMLGKYLSFKRSQ